MSTKKFKYRYNTKTLSYEKIELSFYDRLLKFGGWALTGLVFAVFFQIGFYYFFESPKERQLALEKEELLFQYELLSKRMNYVADALENMQQRDDNLYRTILEAEPIPENIRKAGIGGVNRYKNLENSAYSELLVNTHQKLDQITKQLYIQSKSFDEVFELAERKEDMLLSIPSIMPIKTDDLKRVSSGFGMRLHPILKIRKMHQGQDFTAKTGTDIYATGNGTVERVDRDHGGYGNYVVINHSYGFKSLYAHMSKVNVKKGQKVNRGEVIGLVGNTGRSTAPHLHYEIIKNNRKINPVNYYYADLTPKQYEELIKISSEVTQSFD